MFAAWVFSVPFAWNSYGVYVVLQKILAAI
jgi:hypothetical protein